MANLTELPAVGDDMLAAVTKSMVALHERYYGRKPGSANTRMMGHDLLACMFGDMYTDVEKTLIELQRQALVHETRTAFQQAIEHRIIREIERITGRQVDKLISTHHVGPDRGLELFLLKPATPN